MACRRRDLASAESDVHWLENVRGTVLSHTTHLTQLISHNSSHKTHFTQLMCSPLISHNSCHTTTPLTHLNLHNNSCHRLNPQNSCHATHLSHNISYNSPRPTHLTHIFFHPSPLTTDMIQISSFLSSHPPAFLTHIATHVGLSGPLILF